MATLSLIVLAKRSSNPKKDPPDVEKQSIFV
jgi:hypothetical protein